MCVQQSRAVHLVLHQLVTHTFSALHPLPQPCNTCQSLASLSQCCKAGSPAVIVATVSIRLMTESNLQELQANDAASHPWPRPLSNVTVSLLRGMLADEPQMLEGLPEQGVCSCAQCCATWCVPHAVLHAVIQTVLHAVLRLCSPLCSRLCCMLCPVLCSML